MLRWHVAQARAGIVDISSHRKEHLTQRLNWTPALVLIKHTIIAITNAIAVIITIFHLPNIAFAMFF